MTGNVTKVKGRHIMVSSLFGRDLSKRLIFCKNVFFLYVGWLSRLAGSVVVVGTAVAFSLSFAET